MKEGKNVSKYLQLGQILGSHDDEYEDDCLLGCWTV
jgi:hypothetical protein